MKPRMATLLVAVLISACAVTKGLRDEPYPSIVGEQIFRVPDSYDPDYFAEETWETPPPPDEKTDFLFYDDLLPTDENPDEEKEQSLADFGAAEDQ